jgi:hypothetical protein
VAAAAADEEEAEEEDEDPAGGGRGIVLDVRVVGRSIFWLGARSCDNVGIWLRGLKVSLSCGMGHCAGAAAEAVAAGLSSSVGTYFDDEVLDTCMGHSAGGVPEVGCDLGNEGAGVVGAAGTEVVWPMMIHSDIGPGGDTSIACAVLIGAIVQIDLYDFDMFVIDLNQLNAHSQRKQRQEGPRQLDARLTRADRATFTPSREAVGGDYLSKISNPCRKISAATRMRAQPPRGGAFSSGKWLSAPRDVIHDARSGREMMAQ